MILITDKIYDGAKIYLKKYYPQISK